MRKIGTFGKKLLPSILITQCFFGPISMLLANDDIKQRQELMEDMGKSMKTIKEAINGDLKVVQKAAMELHALAQKTEAAFKTNISTGKTDAKPEIWSKWADFVKEAKSLEEHSMKLAKVTDKKEAMHQFKLLGKEGCGGCHTHFRKDKKHSFKHKKS